MKIRFILFISLLLCVFLFIGCEEFFTFNIFTGLDSVTIPDYKDMNTDELIDSLKEDINSDRFIEEISKDKNKDKKEEVEDCLKDVYTDPQAQEEDIIDTAVLYGEFEIKTTGGELLVDNAVNVVVNEDSINIDELDSDNADDLIRDIVEGSVDEDVLSNKEDFTDMINGFREADHAYDTLADTVDDQSQLEDTNRGEIAMNALMASTVTEVYTAILADNGGDEDAAIQELYDFINDSDAQLDIQTQINDPIEGNVDELLGYAGLETLFE